MSEQMWGMFGHPAHTCPVQCRQREYQSTDILMKPTVCVCGGGGGIVEREE